MPTLAQRALMQRANLAAHGVVITVTAPGGSPVTTTGIWHTPAVDTQPFGNQVERLEARRLMAIPRSGIAELPVGSTVSAPEVNGGDAITFTVDERERVDPEYFYVRLTR